MDSDSIRESVFVTCEEREKASTYRSDDFGAVVAKDNDSIARFDIFVIFFGKGFSEVGQEFGQRTSGKDQSTGRVKRKPI